MSSSRLLLALLFAAAGITAAAFAVDAYVQPLAVYQRLMAPSASVSVAKPELPPMRRRTRFVATDARPVAKARAASGSVKKQTIKPKDKPPLQAAGQWPWGLFSN